MLDIFRKVKKYFFESQIIFFWFFGVFLITQIAFNFFWLASPLKEAISLILGFFYLVLGLILVNLVDKTSRLDLERNQINAMISSIEDAAIAYAKNFEVVLVNPALEKLVGLSKNELIGKIVTPELNNDRRYKSLAQLIFPSLAPLVLEKSLSDYPNRIKIKIFEPTERVLEITTTKVTDEKGKSYGFLKIIHDLTKEEELKKAQSDFITVAAHQLRTPLAGISWAFEMLLNKETENLTPEQEKIIKEGKQATEESIKTVETLLQAAQIEEGKFGFNFSSGDLIKIVEDVFTEYELAAKKDNIKLILYRPEFELKNFIMDPVRIKLALSFLVDNAIKYNVKNGEVRIKIEPFKDKPFVSVAVEDTGLGIPPEDLDKLFSKFFRSKAAMKEKTSGLGLGLYLAKNIIERHGGKIWASSEYGRGSVFTFILPLDPAYIPPQ